MTVYYTAANLKNNHSKWARVQRVCTHSRIIQNRLGACSHGQEPLLPFWITMCGESLSEWGTGASARHSGGNTAASWMCAFFCQSNGNSEWEYQPATVNLAFGTWHFHLNGSRLVAVLTAKSVSGILAKHHDMCTTPSACHCSLRGGSWG